MNATDNHAANSGFAVIRRAASQLRDRIARNRAIARTVRELRALDDTLLEDIGVPRYAIRDVAARMASAPSVPTLRPLTGHSRRASAGATCSTSRRRPTRVRR